MKLSFLPFMWILCFLTVLIQPTFEDCPITAYPDSTIVGSIRGDFTQSFKKQGKQQFIYNLAEPLSSSSPKVALMINGFSFQPEEKINFNIFYKPNPSFSQLLFVFNTTQSYNSKWQWIRFSFIASSNPYFQMGSKNIYNFINTQQDQRKLISTTIALNNPEQKRITKIFLNGISINSSINKNQIDQLRKQIEGYRALTWSPSLIKLFEKKLAQRQFFSIKISDIKLHHNIIDFNVDLGFKQSLEFLSFSYVVFAQNQFIYKNNYIQGQFGFNTSDLVNRPALKNMDMFMLGLEGFKLKQSQYMNFYPQLTLEPQKQTFSLKGSNPFVTQNSFDLTYLAIDKTQEKYCSNCIDGNILFESFCVAQCPSGYVTKKNGQDKSCKLCEIKQFKIPNNQKTQCICALQYFPVLTQNSQYFTCSPCSYQCLTCQSEYKCLTCDTPYLKTYRVLDTLKSQCICAPGYYDDGQNNIKCLKCHESCLTCKGPSLFDCQACPKGRIRGPNGNCICENNFLQKNGSCVCESPNFNYKGYCFSFLNKNSCSENEIQLIVNGSKTRQCKLNYHRFRTLCILCGQNQIVDQQTGKCICKQNHFRDQTTGLCVSCINGKVYDNQLKKCICPKGSFSSANGQCITCKKRQTFFSDQCRCIYNYFKNSWGQCEKCKPDSTNTDCKLYKS